MASNETQKVEDKPVRGNKLKSNQTIVNKFGGSHLIWKLLVKATLSTLILVILISATSKAQTNSKQAQVSVTLILPQSFRAPTNELQGDKNGPKLEQYIAVINNAQDELEDEKLRQKYKKLSLQIRDAKTPITGQLFYEHVFDYFPSFNSKSLLLPINLEQVSATSSYDALSGSRVTNGNHYLRPQQLIISIRPYQLNSGFGSDTIEFVSSPPISLEPVPSYDGRRSFAVIQTDKPIYKPDELVRIRSLIINENFRPITGDEVRLQIKNPQKIIVEEVRFPSSGEGNQNSKNQPLFMDHIFRFPPEPMLGSWTAHLLHADPIANDTISFEVREYVLPTFEVVFESPKYIIPSTQNITGAIVAKYHYGLPVQGKAYFKFGYKENENSKPKFIARSSIKNIDPNTGRVEFRMNAAKIQETAWFPSIAYSRFVIEATVTETTTGHREVLLDSQCTFIPYPYFISFEDTINDFKPSLSQQLTVRLIEMQTQKPAPEGARIVAQYHDQNGTLLQNTSDNKLKLDSEAITDSTGRATFNVGPIKGDINTIQVSLRWFNQSNSGKHTESANELAIGHHTLMKHDSNGGWISIVNKESKELNVGDQYVSEVAFGDVVLRSREVYYVIVARGHIINIESPSSVDGFIRFTITEQMIPSFRLVLFAKSISQNGESIFISDSIRLNVNSNLNCDLKIRYKSNSSTNFTSGNFPPNDQGKLAIKARQGDLVSIIGVDSAVYTLNNRTLLESSRILQRIRRLDPGCGFGGGKSDLDVFHNAGLMLIGNELQLHNDDQPTNNLPSFLGSSCLTVLNQMRHLEDIQLGYARPMFAAASGQSNRARIFDVASTVFQKLVGSSKQLIYGFDPYTAATGVSSRTKRRIKREIDVEGLINSQKDAFSRSCCRLGTLEDIPQKRSCIVRQRIVEKYMSSQFEVGPNKCSAIYFNCCRAVFGYQVALGSLYSSSANALAEHIVGRKLPSLESTSRSAQGDFNIGHMDKIESETLIRRDFRETWLFEMLEIHEPDGSGSLNVQLPHSITSWTIAAMALNRYQPMCLMEKPLKLNTFQEIFIKLSMPYKIIQGEQIDLVASVFNYSPQSQDVVVYSYGVEDVCSEAEPNERSERKRIRIERFSSQALLFPIIPLKTGKYPIKIVAITMNGTSDSIERILNVVARGKTVTDETTFSLDPMNHQRRSKRAIQTGNLVDEIDSVRGVQRSKVRLTPSRDADLIVPQSQECIVSAIGDRLGQTVQTAIVDVENLIRLPHGCGEQVMIYMAPTLYTTHYLRAIDKLSGELRWKAIRYIQGGYKRILNYRKESGAFSAFARREPSIWLTAFIAKMLCQTERTPFINQEVRVDKNVINTALEWLIEEQDKGTGGWIEVNPVYHREMLGGVLKENALTSFIVITLNECSHHSLDLINEQELGPNLQQPTSKESSDVPVSSSFPHGKHSNAVDKLKVTTQKAQQMLLRQKYRSVKEKNPYVMALTAYALSFERPLEAVEMINDLMAISERSYSKNQVYWRGDNNIETAAYVLQAIIELGPVANQHQTNGAEYPSNKISPNPWQRGLDAISISNWLSTRRSFTGAFESTQDTIVALEALSKFAELQATPNNNLLPPPSVNNVNVNVNNNNNNPGSFSPNVPANLVCNVTMTNNNRTRRSLAFRSDNAQILQTFKMDSFDIDTINGEMLDIITSGNGLGTMSVKLKYNVFQEEDELCRFDISSFIEEWKPPKLAQLPFISSDDFRLTNQDSNNNIKAEDLDVNSTTINADDENPFRPFHKSMLDELSVINIHQMDHLEQTTKRPQDFRLRRAALPVSNRDSSATEVSSAKNANSTFQTDDSWTWKLVSSLKHNLSSYFNKTPTTTSTTTTTATDSSKINPNSNTSSMIQDKQTNQKSIQSSQTRRANTSRRSPSPDPMPLIVYPATSPPPNSHMNRLSNDTLINQTIPAGNPMLATQAIGSSQQTRLVHLLKVCVNYLSTRRDSEMAVIEIGILSGFQPNEADLAEITKEVGALAMHVELSADKSMVIIYMKYIPFSGPYCLQFRLIRNTLVYNLQSGYIRAYEYYSPAHSCSNIYTPSRVSNLLETKCDSSGQVCQCASKSLCPATRKLLDLGEIYSVNATDARNRITELVCSKKYDLISFVKLKNVRDLKSAKIFKLTVKVKSDLKGNLTKIMEAQREQKSRFTNAIRKPNVSIQMAANSSEQTDEEDEMNESSLDFLNLTVDSNCIHEDPILLHLAHPNQWKQGGDLMILFARYEKLEKRFFKITSSPNSSGHQSVRSNNNQQSPVVQFPKPKANILSGFQLVDENDDDKKQDDLANVFVDAQQTQYSINLNLDKDSILHDIAYQPKAETRENTNNLILWLELRSRREKWTCPKSDSS